MSDEVSILAPQWVPSAVYASLDGALSLSVDIPASAPEVWIEVKPYPEKEANVIGYLHCRRVAYVGNGLNRYAVVDLSPDVASPPEKETCGHLRELAYPKWITHDSTCPPCA